MPFVGRSVTTRSAEECQKSYDFVRSYQLPFGIQNAWKQPCARTYVEQLLTEAGPSAKQGGKKLAVVTGVTIEVELATHMAEELGVAGRYARRIVRTERGQKLKAAMEAIQAEAKKRKVDDTDDDVVLYETKYDLDSLASAKDAADYVTTLAKKEKYDGKLMPCTYSTMPASSVPRPTVTKDGVEGKCFGRNFLTVHYLTELLRADVEEEGGRRPSTNPAWSTIASISHIIGGDFAPDNFVEHPKQGGAPEGRVEELDDGTIKYVKDLMMEGAAYLYGRAKLAVVAETQHMQKLHPELNFVCLHPGSIASNFGGDMGIAAKIYYWGFYFFQFTPSQGAVAALRACLDPDFNTEADLQGAYLHCDGDPWTPNPPSSIDPATNEVYTLEAFAKATSEAADAVVKKLVKN